MWFSIEIHCLSKCRSIHCIYSCLTLILALFLHFFFFDSSNISSLTFILIPLFSASLYVCFLLFLFDAFPLNVFTDHLTLHFSALSVIYLLLLLLTYPLHSSFFFFFFLHLTPIPPPPSFSSLFLI